MTNSEQGSLSETTSDFVKTHCRICAAGLTITRHGGMKATFCLLLRDWVTDKHGRETITDCDRFEIKELPEGVSKPPDAS